MLLPAQAQSLDVFSEGRLCVGYQSGFTIYSLLGDQHPLSLVHPDNQVLGFLAYNPVDAMGAVEMANGEFLLVFNTLGVYVDVQGRKSRDKVIGVIQGLLRNYKNYAVKPYIKQFYSSYNVVFFIQGNHVPSYAHGCSCQRRWKLVGIQ